MTYSANVVEVMIASPSDVSTERGVIRAVLSDWNALNAQRSGVVLLPVGWETHAVPQMGGRAQQIINRDVLARCDLLIAVFWTRLGSPTGEAPSGTVEEIHEHVAAGKIAMVYFSNAPVRPDSVDDEQYRALRAFRMECEGNGLIEVFESPADLREKLFRHLSRIVPERFPSLTREPLTAAPSSPPVPALSAQAKRLLEAASQDRNGRIMYLRVMGGPMIQVNGEQLNDPKNAREQATWDAALEELEKVELIAPANVKREFFKLTARGYEIADQLGDG